MTDQTQTTTEPVACPFCGGEAVVSFGLHSFNDAVARCLSCDAEGGMFDVDDGNADESGRNEVAAIAAWNRRPALSPPAEGIGMAANEVGAWIAKRDSEYEAALSDLTQQPCIDSLDDFGRTIYSALEDCPAMSVDKQADFIARAFWPLIATPTQPDTGDVAALREASVPVSAIVAFDVEEYVDGYELRADEGAYMPTEHERGLITDAIHGVLSEVTMLKVGSGGLSSGVAALQDLLTATKINCDGEPESVAFASGVIEAYETFRLAALSKPNAPGREG